MNSKEQSGAMNDIDLNMIEFYNLNPLYYEETFGIENRNFFLIDKEQ